MDKKRQFVKVLEQVGLIYELQRDYDAAQKAVSKALDVNPRHPALLFKLGGIEYHRHSYALAAKAFKECVNASEDRDDDYYLDAAKVAQAKSLCCDGDFDAAKNIIEVINPKAATWLDGRLIASQVLDEIHSH